MRGSNLDEKIDPLFDPLRADARYERVLAKLGARLVPPSAGPPSPPKA